ncbi:MAG: hypothetical protein QOH63_2403 [Acidobacteriota bacterium]|jgi:hypothetical protein|nr:hypothetical protein [Acidobacteriota bacterium]
MNVRKHLAGLAIFSVILGSAIFINAYLTNPVAIVSPARIKVSPTQISTGEPQPISYSISQVTLDFINKKSYTELHIKRMPDQPVPETLWVTTYFFSPEYPGRVWTSKTEIRHPFSQGDQTDLAVAALCGLCIASNITPLYQAPDSTEPVLSHPPTKTGYFARVYVSTDYADNPYPAGVQFDRDIETATPVVVDWPDKLIY